MRSDVATDSTELLTDPGAVGVDGLSENEFVADTEDEGFQGVTADCRGWEK